jgi:CobQ-like glutamine amidotransferase family enzyme
MTSHCASTVGADQDQEQELAEEEDKEKEKKEQEPEEEQEQEQICARVQFEPIPHPTKRES